MGVCSDTASSATTNSLAGCVGLAANGAGPRRYTAGVTPASVRNRDRWTEARTGPGPVLPLWLTTSELPRCDHTRAGPPREDPPSASSGRPSERRVPGSDQPKSSCTPTPILHPSGVSDGACDTLYGAGVDPASVPRPSLVQLHRVKGLMIIAQQLP